MSSRPLIICTIASFAVIFFFEWIFHGIYMMPAYNATAALWRPEKDMQDMFGLTLLRQLAQAWVIAWLYLRLVYDPGMVQGLRFGFGIGALMGLLQFASYTYLPLPTTMAISWFAGGLTLGVLLGMTLGILSNSKVMA